ncbi:sensor histidine kinase [Ferrovibrio xuzhouensis]|uniref:histidine kinase n=1 Tax=Ferrovibrio xuzhouensis TaxID=1576914 RepID=A0ABV7VB66_9PROT
MTAGRPRRLMSPLTRRILLINLAAPISLVLAFLYLDQFRLGLIETRLTSLRYEANLMSGALGEAAISPYELTPALEPETARQLLRRLSAQSSARARLFDTDGEMVADSRLLLAAGRGVITRQLPPPQIDTPWERALIGIYDHINALFMTRLDLPKYVELPYTHANDYAEVRRALTGDDAQQLRDLGSGRILLSVAVPVQGLRKVVGALMLTVDSTEIDNRVREERLTALKVFAAVLGFTVLASLYLAGAIVRPIHRLADAAERIRAAKGRIGHLHIPDFSGRSDEIGDLSTVLRAMTSALSQRLDAIERFAADVAHEIKNPLTSLRSAMETFARTEKPELRERLLVVMQDDVGRMNRLISDISESSRLDAELARSDAEPIDIAEMLQAVVDTYAARGAVQAMPKIELKRIEPGPYLASAFEGRLGQVIRNLIDNAISFSPEGGTITVAVRREPRHVVFTVTDDGPGIPAESLESIFDRFYSERPSSEAFGLHSGLGLPIARQIVQSLGGQIHAENRDDGHSGARFTVRLPL